MSMALSSVPQAIPSLYTTVCRPTLKKSPPSQASVWLSRVVLGRHLRLTLCGRHTVVKTALLSSALVHRVLCSLTKLLAKESGQRSLRPKSTATHGLYECCRRMEVDTWSYILLECYLAPIIGSPQVWWIWKRHCKLKDNLWRQTSHTKRVDLRTRVQELWTVSSLFEGFHKMNLDFFKCAPLHIETGRLILSPRLMSDFLSFLLEATAASRRAEKSYSMVLNHALPGVVYGFLRFNPNGSKSKLMFIPRRLRNPASFFAIGFVSREKTECLSCNLMIVWFLTVSDLIMLRWSATKAWYAVCRAYAAMTIVLCCPSCLTLKFTTNP